MKITETHKNFPCGSKGRLTVTADSGEVLLVVFTPVQKARKFCEANPETPEGVAFAQAMVDANRADLKTRLEELEELVADTVGSEHEHAITSLLQFQNENAIELAALRAASAPVAVPAPPVLAGANPENTALISAQRKLMKLYEAALGSDPVAALEAIRTSRGNKYLNTCDDYRLALLAHFRFVVGA